MQSFNHYLKASLVIFNIVKTLTLHSRYVSVFHESQIFNETWECCFYVFPSCRFQLICTLVSTTLNRLSVTVLKSLNRMQARNIFQSYPGSISLNPGDEQQTPSAEIQLCGIIWLLILVENMTLVSPIILTITHTALIQSLRLPSLSGSARGIWPDLGKHGF